MPYLNEDGVEALWDDAKTTFLDKVPATVHAIGGVKPDDQTITVDQDGTMHGVVTAESDGSEAGPIVSLTANGHAEQASTTGKNLLDYGTVMVGKTWKNATNTKTGVVQVAVTENTTYTLSLTSEYGVTIINKRDGGVLDSSKIDPTVQIDGGGTFTTPSECTYVAVQFTTTRDSSGQTVAEPPSFSASMVSNVQLEAGSTATSYEPYTGGAPSPSPDYPQEIQVVRGRNLLDESRSSVGYKVDESGAQIESSGLACSDYIPVSPNTTYYVTNCVSSSSTWSMCAYNNAKAFLRGISLSGSGNVSGSFNTGDNTAYIRVNYRASQNPNYVGPPQLELGSTPQPYVPYGYVGLEAQGKNLLPNGPDITSTTSYGVTITRKDGVMTFNGTANGEGGRTREFYSNRTAYLDAGTYTISIAGSKNANVVLGTVQSDGIIAKISRNTVDSKSFTLSEPMAVYVGINLTHGAVYNDTINFQIERGSEATDYEPYYHTTTPIPLPSRGWVAGLPDGTADVLTLDSAGKVMWEKKTDETTQAVTDGVTGTVSVDVLSTTGQIADGATVLYPIATPVTEDMGYVMLPDVPEGASISIPELDNLGVRYAISIPTVLSGYEERIAALEAAIAEIIAG